MQLWKSTADGKHLQPNMLEIWTRASIEAAMPASWVLNPMDQKHIDMAVGAQLQIVWNELWFRRSDLQLQLLAACPGFGKESAGDEGKIFCETSGVIDRKSEKTIGYFNCWPSPLALSLQVAMRGLPIEFEQTRAFFAKFVPLIIQATQFKQMASGQFVAQTEQRKQSMRNERFWHEDRQT